MRDASEVIAEMRARATNLHGKGYFVIAANLREWADRLEAALPAAEPADAGRDAVAWLYRHAPSGSLAATVGSSPAQFVTDNPSCQIIGPLYDRPHVAAVDDVQLATIIQNYTGCGDSDSVYAAIAVRDALNSQQARSQG